MENLKLKVKLAAYSRGVIPTKLSDLENDMDFVVDPDYVHTDNNLTDELKEHIEGSVRFDITQSLTEEQKARARENIGVADTPEFEELEERVSDLEDFENDQLLLNENFEGRVTTNRDDIDSLTDEIDNVIKPAIQDITEELGFIDSDIEDLQNTKLDKNLGSINKDKILSIDEEGDITPIDLPETLFADNETIVKDSNGTLTAVALRRTGGGLVTADDIKDLELDVANYKITTNQKINDIENINEDQQEEIEYVTKRVNTLVGSGGYLTANNFGSAVPSQNDLTNYALNEIGITDYLEIWNATKVKNTFNGHTWVLTNTQDTTPAVFEWTDQGIDYVALATDGSAGIVKGSIDQFKVSVDMFGEMSVNGLEEALENVTVKTDDITIKTNLDDKLEVMGITDGTDSITFEQLQEALTFRVYGV